MQTGKVYLVGAGPGDPGMLTLRALEVLREADAVLYDALVSPSVLRCVPVSASLEFAGKRAGGCGRTQDHILQSILEHAGRGEVVVRLKGGDPFVFGRGGEEAEFLSRNGIPFEVVPGLTSGLSAPASAGIPVTDRRMASSVALVSGHEDPEKLRSRVHWRALAGAVDTLVVYMGRSRLGQIALELKEAGLAGRTPVAVIQWGATPAQNVLLTTLEAAPSMKLDDAGPALIVVGEVVNLRRTLAWFENRPLFGKRVVVTRHRAASELLVRRLETAGADAILCPAIELVPISPNPALRDVLVRLGDFRWIVLTSAAGVDVFAEALFGEGLDARALAGTRVASVGPGTSEALRSIGIAADCVPPVYTTERLAQAIIAEGELTGSRVLLLRSEAGSDVLPDRLKAAGALVREVHLYGVRMPTEPPPGVREALETRSADYTLVASPSAGEGLLEQFGQGAPVLLGKVIAIGPVTAERCRELGYDVAAVAEEHTVGGMVEALLSQVEQAG